MSTSPKHLLLAKIIAWLPLQTFICIECLGDRGRGTPYTGRGIVAAVMGFLAVATV